LIPNIIHEHRAFVADRVRCLRQAWPPPKCTATLVLTFRELCPMR
jgi:hypothetical protein